MIKRHCPVCGVAVEQARFLFKKRSYRIVQCRNCGLVFVDPPPTPKAAEQFYSRRDYFDAPDGFGYVGYTDSSLRQYGETWGYRLDRLAERIQPPGHLIDLGCATGGFLEMGQKRGWDVSGVEISSYAAETAKANLGVVVARTMEEVPSESADVVTAWEYVEHLIDPSAEIHKIWRVLKPGGWFALSTPNTENMLAREDLWAWAELKPPEHLVFFTPKTLEHWLGANSFRSIHIEGIVPIGYLHPAWFRRITRTLDHLGVGPVLRRAFGRWQPPSEGPREPVSTEHAAMERCLGLLAFGQKPSSAEQR